MITPLSVSCNVCTFAHSSSGWCEHTHCAHSFPVRGTLDPPTAYAHSSTAILPSSLSVSPVFRCPLLPLQLFLKPIQARSLLPPDAVSVVFGNIEHILALNRELLSYIRQKGPVDAFINMGPFLKVYATYANNYNNALEVVQVCGKDILYIHTYVRTYVCMCVHGCGAGLHCVQCSVQSVTSSYRVLVL